MTRRADPTRDRHPATTAFVAGRVAIALAMLIATVAIGAGRAMAEATGPGGTSERTELNVPAAPYESNERGSEAVHPCEAAATLATGRPDPALFAYEASEGVRAYWCETYDAEGTARRAGPYWDLHPNGVTRVRARYVDSRIDGAVEVFDDEGELWLRGELEAGAWSGPLVLFHANGVRWLAAHFRAGKLDGPVETWFPDGSLESRTHFQDGREDGIATSYYPAVDGGGLRTEVRVEGDQIVDRGPGIGSGEPAATEAMPDSLPMARREPSQP